MGEQNFSITLESCCTGCNKSDKMTTHALSVESMETIETNNFLDKTIQKISKNFSCNECMIMVETSVKIQNYLVVDIEDCKMQINVKNLKNEIWVQDECFEIVGAISYVVGVNGKKEYQSYHKSITHVWKFQNFHDGKEHNVTKKCSKSTFSLLIYIPKPNYFGRQ